MKMMNKEKFSYTEKRDLVRTKKVCEAIGRSGTSQLLQGLKPRSM